ncbi:MAG TPA: TetR/AcrR family transcriptional regulator [Actinomycetales bacterium]|nr:TetR/AcrR family transcriptional regulator [Actinomycetales bacterium]
MSAVSIPALGRQDRREQILSAGLDAFVQEGFHQTSMDNIAERIGVTKPILYRYFSSKLELYLAIVDAQTDKLVNRVTAALHAPALHQRDRVRAAFSAYFKYIEAEGASFRLIFESDVSFDEDLRERVERSNRLCAREIAQTLLSFTALSEVAAELLATALVGMAQTTARTRLRDPRGVSSDEAIDLLTQLAWRGLSRFPALD